MENNTPSGSTSSNNSEQASDPAAPKITIRPKTEPTGPPPQAAETSADDDSDTVLSGTFTNFSSTQFSRNSNGWTLETGFSAPGTWPGVTLQANSGQQTMSMTEELTWFAQGPIDIYCTWFDSTTGWRFGICISASYQMFGIGPRPVWYVMSDQNKSWQAPDWTDSGTDPSQPYTWTGLPFSVTATPTSGHSSLSVQVQITTLS